tara:strand:+ start:6188 stop:7099 length:912 start_codon:yes stop_codon:yes gene_type:complete
MTKQRILYGSIEIGGTKINCAVAETTRNSNSIPSILKEKQIQTKTPDFNLNEIFKFFNPYNIHSLGIGSFGPIELDKNSKNFGKITSTPKILWRDFDLLNNLKEKFSCNIYIDTDVNVAALAEGKWGFENELQSCLYLTIGTGIGGGMFLNNKLLHGISHPEMGHIIVKKHPDDNFKGVCPHHEDCLEGLASGFAIEKRFSKKAQSLNPKEKILMRKIISYYLGQALANYILILSPNKIILGGGVMNNKNLLIDINLNVKKILNDYILKKEFNEKIDQYIVSPKLGKKSGIYGGFALCVFASN